MRLLDINEIDPVNFSFSVNVAFKFYWVDNRVKINESTSTNVNITHHIDVDFLTKIWTPDFYIYDLQSFNVLGSSRRAGLRVQKNSTTSHNNDTEIQYLVEWEVVFKCPINYSKFPFHTATCRLVPQSD